MQIINMKQLNQGQIDQATKILKDSFPLWILTQEEALQVMQACLISENTMLAAVENGVVLGWGGILAPTYSGNVFELHPLAVRCDKRGQGIGSAIVTALEAEAKKQGGITIYLGSDDDKEGGETSFSNTDLYEDLPSKIQSFTSGTHPTGFYRKLGYQIIGVMPDANGAGKPDIFLGKRLS